MLLHVRFVEKHPLYCLAFLNAYGYYVSAAEHLFFKVNIAHSYGAQYAVDNRHDKKHLIA
jgi:hypothetical protein